MESCNIYSAFIIDIVDTVQVFDTGAGQQGLVVSCLEDNIDHLSAGCLKQIDKKEEVAAESIELDAALAQVSSAYVRVCE